MIRRLLPSLTLLAIAALLVAAAAAMAWRGATASVVGVTVATAMALAGVAAVRVAHQVAGGEPDDEVRAVKGPGLRRRTMLLRGGVGAVTVTAVALSFPAARRLDRATRALQQTPWQAGTRLVDDGGDPVRADAVTEGEMLTVWPEGFVGSNDAQTILLREPPDRLTAVAGREDWAPDGFVAYSRLCTHMACPVGLYQQRIGTLLCPCHQAVFDALDGGRVVNGPARRALPQLPLAIEDGILVARGDFSDAVGTGFWYRP